MEYIIENWNELNLADRSWFVVGAWLFILFWVAFIGGIIRSRKKQRKNYSPKS